MTWGGPLLSQDASWLWRIIQRPGHAAALCTYRAQWPVRVRIALGHTGQLITMQQNPPLRYTLYGLPIYHVEQRRLAGFFVHPPADMVFIDMNIRRCHGVFIITVVGGVAINGEGLI